MTRYQLTPLEQDLSSVNLAMDIAMGHLGRVYQPDGTNESPDITLPDLSFEGAQRRAEIGARILKILEAVDDERIPHDWALSSKLLRYYAGAWSREAEFYWLAIDPISQLFYGPFGQTVYTGGYLLGAISAAATEFSFDHDGDGDRYLALLSAITRLLWQIHDRTAGQAARGIRIHKPQLPAVRQLLQRLRTTARSAYAVDGSRLSNFGDASGLRAEISQRVDQCLVPAFDALIAQLDAEYERHAPDEVGLDKLPGGREAYAWLLKLNTTRDLTPEQVHADGHARMARIKTEMKEVRASLGFEGTATEFAAHLRLLSGTTVASGEDVGERMRRHKDGVEKRFGEFFHQRAPCEYDLVRLAPSLEGSMTWGYYQPPQGKERRGLYHYNGGKLDSLAVIAAASLVFHELVPGHHLHLGLQQNNLNLPKLRRNAYVNAYNEGWAEYAATLAGEMGLYDDPYDRYGRLCMDAFLTSRLIVDTGMNALGWTWEQAKDYLRTHTLCAEAEIGSDSLRYSCGIPAQALAYKLGDEELLRMREEARQRMNGELDLRDFHAAILDVGGLPLPVLEWHLKKVFTGSESPA